MSGTRRHARTSATASPYMRFTLATGEYPPAGTRLPGWVAAMVTLGIDNAPLPELVARYGAALCVECEAAGFRPQCDLPDGESWTAEETVAAQLWAAALVREHSY